MSQETENVLRKSLDEVDRIKKRQAVVFVILFCAVMEALWWLGHMSENSATDVRKLIVFAVCVLFLAMIFVAVAFARVQSRMTLKILKAIELLSRR
jgi:hypothetical protein